MKEGDKARHAQVSELSKANAEAFSQNGIAPDCNGAYASHEDAERLLRLILGLSTNFISLPPDDVNDGINDVLKAIGDFAGVDRSYVYQLFDNEKKMIRTHEWCARGIKNEIQNAQSVFVSKLPWFYEKIRSYEVVHIPDVSELPYEATAEKEEFLQEGIQSIVAVPIMSGYSVMGFIGFESICSKKIWSENIISLLKIIGEIFAFAISRRKVTEALNESESKYQALFEYANDAIFLIKGEHFIDCNTKTLSIFGCTRGQIIGHSPGEFSPPNQPDGRNSREKSLEMGRLTLSGKPQFFEWKHHRYDGRPFYAEISLNRVDLGNEVFLQAIVRDITDRKQAEEKLEHTLANLRQAMGGTIKVIAQMVETKDPYTAGHQRRVADLARAIATEMGLPHNMIEGIRMAGVIHDIGKISVPSEILSKPGKLTYKQFELIKDHSRTGYDILQDVEFPWPITNIILQHHEKMDGSGYPQGLKGEEILLEARILAVADVVDAIASYRPYRPALGIDTALEEILNNKGKIYDEHVVDACLKLFSEKAYKFEN